MAKEHITETLDLGVTDPSKTAEARQDRHLEGKLDWIVFGITSILAIAKRVDDACRMLLGLENILRKCAALTEKPHEGSDLLFELPIGRGRR